MKQEEAKPNTQNRDSSASLCAAHQLLAALKAVKYSESGLLQGKVCSSTCSSSEKNISSILEKLQHVIASSLNKTV